MNRRPKVLKAVMSLSRRDSGSEETRNIIKYTPSQTSLEDLAEEAENSVVSGQWDSALVRVVHAEKETKHDYCIVFGKKALFIS